VTLLKGQEFTLQVRFKGGAIRTLIRPKALPAPQLCKTKPDLVQTIDQLLDQATEAAVAAQLNQQGIHSALGRPITAHRVAYVRRTYKLRSRYQRLREQGLLTPKEVAAV
jgi:hypothetical protein